MAWWHPYSEASPTDIEYYLSLESEAASISHFCPLVPGLLQTSATHAPSWPRCPVMRRA